MELGKIKSEIRQYFDPSGRDIVRLCSLLVFGGLCWIYTLSYMSDVPRQDEWYNIDFVAAIAEGHFNILSLFSPDQSHSVFFFRIGTLLETVLLQYDPRFRIVLGLVLTTLSALIFFRFYRNKGWIGVLGCFVSSILLFSLANWENLLAPYSVNSAATNLFMFAAVLSATRHPVLAIVCGAISSVSFTNGLAVWPSLVLVLWQRKDYTSVRNAVVVGAILMVRGAIFSIEHPFSSHMSFGAGIARFFTVVGLPVAFPGPHTSDLAVLHAMICGMLLTAVIAVIFVANCRKADAQFWNASAIILFGIISCAMIAFGRSGLEVVQATSSRYFATAATVYIGILMWTCGLPEPRTRWVLGCAVSVMCCLSATVSYHSEYVIGPYRGQFFAKLRNDLVNYHNTPLEDNLFQPEQLASFAAVLEKLKLGPFRD